MHNKGQDPDGINEAAPAYNTPPKKQGEFTLEDYLALPDNVHAELIDGMIYAMGSPSNQHQLIAGELYLAVRQYIRSRKGSCIPFIAPADIQLDCDDKTIVQPDIFIVCDRSKIGPLRIFGAPDFIAEILSPSTWEKDMFIKARKYKSAGVREYWIINPMKKTVLVYRFEKSDTVEIHHFTEKVEVGIFRTDDPEDRLLIDFSEIENYISFISET